MARRDIQARDRLNKVRRKLRLERFPPITRKIIVGILGGVCVVAGVVMLFTPGPAVVFIPLGLLLLATEFPWAERWLHRTMEAIHKVRARWRLRRRRRRGQPRS